MTRNPRRRTALGAILVLGAALACGCGHDKGSGPTGPPITDVPESWRGVWKLNVTGTSCGFAVPIPGEISFEQTLCPGERITLALPVDLGGGACGGGAVSATETSIHFTCSGPYSEGSCTGTIQAVFDIALQPANGTLGGSGELKVQFEPGADCSSGYCYKLAITGQRISSTPDCPPPSGSQESFLGRVRTPIRSRG